MKTALYLIPTLLTLAYEGEDKGGDGNKETNKETNKGGEGGKTTFTQEDVNRMMADEKRKMKTQNDKIVAELEALKTKTNLTAQEREELETRIESMKSEYMTKEELLKQEKAKAEKKLQAELEDAKKGAENWKSRFTQSTITREITDAAVKTEAFNPQQIVKQLLPDTRLTEELDEQGKPTGEFVVKVKITDKDKDGKDITLDLPVLEAVKKMSEKDDFANLFKGKGTGGIGGQNRSGGRTPDIATAAKDPATYRRLRAEGKIQL